MQFTTYIFIIHCIIFHTQYNFVMAIYGHHVRRANNIEFPGLVSIMSVVLPHPTTIQMDHKCTGTLISRQDVLTAEHCLRETFREGFKVLVGSIDLAQASEYYPLFIWTFDNWVLFRNINPSDDNDIALVKLFANTPTYVEFSPIGNIQSDLLYGLNAELVGWGRLLNGTKPRFLHTGAVRILGKEECQDTLFTLEGIRFNISEKRLCTIGDPYAVLGHGDSGGPLIFFGTTIGVNSGVIPSYGGTTQPDQVNMHLNIRNYIDYIQDVIVSFKMNL